MWRGVSAQSNGTFGSFENLGLALLVLILIILFNRSSNRYLRMSSIVIGLIIGYLVAWGLGRIDFSAVQSFGGFNIPLPFKYGLDFDFSAFIALGFSIFDNSHRSLWRHYCNSLISGRTCRRKNIHQTCFRRNFGRRIQFDAGRYSQLFSKLRFRAK